VTSPVAEDVAASGGADAAVYSPAASWEGGRRHRSDPRRRSITALPSRDAPTRPSRRCAGTTASRRERCDAGSVVAPPPAPLCALPCYANRRNRNPRPGAPPSTGRIQAHGSMSCRPQPLRSPKLTPDARVSDPSLPMANENISNNLRGRTLAFSRGLRSEPAKRARDGGHRLQCCVRQGAVRLVHARPGCRLDSVLMHRSFSGPRPFGGRWGEKSPGASRESRRRSVSLPHRVADVQEKKAVERARGERARAGHDEARAFDAP